MVRPLSKRQRERKLGLRTGCRTHVFCSIICLMAQRGTRKLSLIPLRLESLDTASEVGQHSLHLTSSGVSEAWWRSRQGEVPSRNRGFFGGSLLSVGAVTFRRCIWPRRMIFHYHWPGCTNCSKGLRQLNKW